MTQPILYGKNTILFPFEYADMDYFVKLHREDKKGNMGKFCFKEMSEYEAKMYTNALISHNQIKVWTVQSKTGKDVKYIGFVYLSDFTSFSCNISGIIDKEFFKGTAKKLREGKHIYSKDAVLKMVDYCFNGLGFERVETSIGTRNIRSIKLMETCGFVREGVARKAFKLDNEFYDVAMYSILKEEYTNGKTKTADA